MQPELLRFRSGCGLVNDPNFRVLSGFAVIGSELARMKTTMQLTLKVNNRDIVKGALRTKGILSV